MKKLMIPLCILSLYSCGNDKAAKADTTMTEMPEKLYYDTVAIDSFSPGAVSLDVATQIRRSSLRYQDSLRKAKQMAEEAAMLKKAQELKAKQEAEKKKSSAE